MSGCNYFEKDPCTACDPRVPATPLSLYNPPGQGALRYRAGTFSTFRQAMLDALVVRPVISQDPVNATARYQLTTRDETDFAVATLDLWAYVCDVLTFYQQAIANEAFLRTAVLRESLARQGMLLGYKPARGKSATVYVAFTADKDTRTTVPAGTKLQSVPADGSQPATFETSESLLISTAANQPLLMGAPVAATFTTSAELKSDLGGPAVAPGTRLLFYKESPAERYENTVAKVTPTTLGKRVEWLGNLGGKAITSLKVARMGRKLRLFGAAAPDKYLVPDSSNPPVFTVSNTDFSFSASNIVSLDGTFENISSGSRLLVVHDNGSSVLSYVRTVQSVSQGSSARGPITGACTTLTLDSNLDACSDIRHYQLFELIGDDLVFFPNRRAETVLKNSTKLYLLDVSGLAKDSRLLVKSGEKTQLVQVTQVVTESGGPPDSVLITPKLEFDCPVATTVVYGNVVAATHGEAQQEKILGNGDASSEWQVFNLPVSPTTYVDDPAAPTGAASTLHVYVNDQEWHEVDSFYARGPSDAIFQTSVDDSGKEQVRFGDGRTGRRVPTGSQNVRAVMRKGLGVAGNATADTVTAILQSRPGMKAVTNPGPATGGADAETADSIRRAAPGTVVTFDRAVSLKDYEALTLAYFRGGKAKAAWADFGSKRGVKLTVSPPGGSPLSAVAKDLRSYLDLHRDPNVPLSISEATKVPFVLRVTVHVLEGWKQSAVMAAVEMACGTATGFLSFDRMPLGDTVFQSAILAQFQSVPGVEWVFLRGFSTSVPDHGFPPAASKMDAVFVGPDEVGWPALDGSTTTPSIDIIYQGGIADVEVI
ncbi:putative baseplate assembly protein [uncultured Paludibaculum sp.]|uniref:putative baseplate assembly protein n=1 Tax=uncultured Paludibaculum sp. TaxID=1765020 RepID=UPI002AAACB22|nr:putative baseplate assembly protein [uncultured Paludibaculum sp.]